MPKRLFPLAFIIIFTCFSIFFTMSSTNNAEPENIEVASRTPLPALRNPLILIKKKERLLYLYDGDQIVKTYKIALGFAPEKDKEREGDGRTPEGEFYLFTKNPQSRFYLSLGISYPSVDDAERGLRENLISRKEHDAIIRAIKEKRMPPQKTKLGGEIYIHGGGNQKDWTWGCAALENEDIKELFDTAKIGMKVVIEP